MAKKFLISVAAIAVFSGFYLISQPVGAGTQNNSVWIEAESAVSFNTRLGVSNPMAREKNPSWRPPYFGDGSWYMGAGGDYLIYEFSVPRSGKYNVWIRDYVDKFQPRGVRRIVVEFDDKKYGVFPEVNIPSEGEKGAFGWHKIGSGVELQAGRHKMRIVKESTTSGAAILDAFYFTLENEVPPKKIPSEPAEEASVNKTAIQYPIVELGNCGNEADCKNYCSKQENMVACATFGEKMGLVSSEDAKKAKEYADVLRGEGPGGCKSPQECQNYCADISRVNECVPFAEKHNLIPPEQLKEAKQVMQALSQGAKLPGDCKDKNSCQSYCAQPQNGEECLGFAEKAGFVSPAEAEQARKVMPFLARGETPGKCKTKQECESYCSSETNTMECVNFAEKAGFMTAEEAEIVRKTGGKGPGGCRSKETCEAYCNQPENQNACFEFAQQHNLIPEEKLKEIKEGMGRLRAGLAQAPEEAVVCLKEKLGGDIVSQIEGGSFMPSPQSGELIKGCFMKVLPQIKEKFAEGLKHADEETKTCLEKGLGSGGIDAIFGGEAPDPQKGDVVRVCFETMREKGMKKLREGLGQMPPEMRSCVEDKLGRDFVAKVEAGEEVEVGPQIGSVFQECAGAMTQIMDKMLEQVPPEIRNCIKEKITDPAAIRGPQDVQPLIQECIKSFVPQGIPSGPEEFMPPGTPPMSSQGGIPEGTSIPESACAGFQAALSCDYVPENMREMCKKCRGE